MGCLSPAITSMVSSTALVEPTTASSLLDSVEPLGVQNVEGDGDGEGLEVTLRPNVQKPLFILCLSEVLTQA